MTGGPRHGLAVPVPVERVRAGAREAGPVAPAAAEELLARRHRHRHGHALLSELVDLLVLVLPDQGEGDGQDEQSGQHKADGHPRHPVGIEGCARAPQRRERLRVRSFGTIGGRVWFGGSGQGGMT